MSAITFGTNVDEAVVTRTYECHCTRRGNTAATQDCWECQGWGMVDVYGPKHNVTLADQNAYMVLRELELPTQGKGTVSGAQLLQKAVQWLLKPRTGVYAGYLADKMPAITKLAHHAINTDQEVRWG